MHVFVLGTWKKIYIKREFLGFEKGGGYSRFSREKERKIVLRGGDHTT